MLKEKFISITDLRKNASTYIGGISKSGEKIIFVNNKPKAVLIDFDIYDRLINDKVELYQSYDGDLTIDDKKELEKVKIMKEEEFYNI